MRPLRMLRALCLGAAFAAAPYVVSCDGSDTTQADAGEGDPALADVVYEGGTTDEALGQMLAAQAEIWEWKAGLFDSPTEGQVLPASPVPTFAWHQDSAPPDAGGASLRLGPPRSRVSSLAPGAGRFAGALAELLGPEREAKAHGAPFNGTAFFLVFSTPKNDKLLRVFTSATTYTPSAAAWAKLTSAGVPITLTIESAIFENNELAADGGPYAGSSVTFSVSP